MKKIRTKKQVFIEFLAVGLFLGVVEDLLAILFGTGQFSLKIVLIAFLVALPFALFSEVFIDAQKKYFKRAFGRWAIILEFIFIGLLIGLAEDLIAIKFATGAAITWEVVIIAFIITIPFAIFSEIIVDKAHMLKIKN